MNAMDTCLWAGCGRPSPAGTGRCSLHTPTGAWCDHVASFREKSGSERICLQCGATFWLPMADRLRDLCSADDLNHFADHSWCIRHDVQVPIGDDCPITRSTLAEMWSDAYEKGRDDQKMRRWIGQAINPFTHGRLT